MFVLAVRVTMAFSQMCDWGTDSWGVAPGYDEGRPLAKGISVAMPENVEPR